MKNIEFIVDLKNNNLVYQILLSMKLGKGTFGELYIRIFLVIHMIIK